MKILNKKGTFLITISILILFTVSVYLIFKHNKNYSENNNKALIDYYKIASIDFFLDIEKDEGNTYINYTYNKQVPNPEKKDIREITKREVTLFYNGYARQKQLVDLNYNKYRYYNFPQDIMDKVYSDAKFYYPGNRCHNSLQDNEFIKEINKYAEHTLSLSFDKSYSIDQVKKLLEPYGDITWLWVDTYKEQEVSNKTEFLIGEYHDWTGEKKIPVDDETKGQAFGIKMLDEQNHIIQNPDDVFIKILNEYSYPTESEAAKKIYEVKECIKKESPVTKNDIGILGCVIKCKKENVLKLNNLQFIRGIYLNERWS